MPPPPLSIPGQPTSLAIWLLARSAFPFPRLRLRLLTNRCVPSCFRPTSLTNLLPVAPLQAPPMSLPPRPPVLAAARGGYGARSSPMLQLPGSSMSQGSQDSSGCEELVNLDWMENGGVGLLRRRVVPPMGLGAQIQQFSFSTGGQPPHFPFPSAVQVDGEEELSGDAMLILFRFLVCS